MRMKATAGDGDDKMIKRYCGVIFDLDGVLCSTDEYHYQAWKALAEKLGIPGFSREDNARQRGVSRMESLEVVLEKAPRAYTREEKLELAEWKNASYRRLLENMSEADLAPEVRETLEALRTGGFRLAVGSSSKNAPFILERIGLGGWFDAVADGNDITHSKPDPEVFLLAAARLGLRPVDCLVVEDAYSGIDAGNAGGFDTAGIGTAAGYARATYKLNRFKDLTDILENGTI